VPPDGSDEYRDRILIVDGDLHMRRRAARILADAEFEVDLAHSAKVALERATRMSFSLAICDVQLPDRFGLELAAELRATQPHLAILMVSAEDNPLVAATAAERVGAFSYLVKPFTPNELRINVSNALLHRRLERSAAAHQQSLKQVVDERTRELQAAVRELLSSREATIRHLAKAVEMRDPTTHAHIDRIGEISAVLARALRWPRDQVELLRIAAPMHDVGKIGIADRILLKSGPLTATERAEMECHTTIGHEILSGSDSELLNLAATIALTHHERVDGAGYPRGLHGEEIPEAGRIVAVADAFDALINDRVYRAAVPLPEAVRIMREGRGTQFDEVVLDALFDHLDEVLAVQASAYSPPTPGLTNAATPLTARDQVRSILRGGR
jgi:putative two-component system response regulator